MQPGVISKAILETASGVRLWQTLRTVSDYALIDRMNATLPKADMKCLPSFIHSLIQAFPSDLSIDENSDPNHQSTISHSSNNKQPSINLEVLPTNAVHSIVKRNIRAANVHIHD
jgi:hypothetical protein